MTIGEVCHELNNYFDRDMPKFRGAFEIRDGRIVDEDFVMEIKPNQYFRIIGSVFNDGVWKNDENLHLTDELFLGAVWFMAVPPEFVEIFDEMAKWETEHGEQALSPFASESFGGYSYSKGSVNTSGGKSGAVNVFNMFSGRLNKWRKMR